MQGVRLYFASSFWSSSKPGSVEATLRKGWDIVSRNQGKIASLVMDMLSFSKEREPDMAAAQLEKVVGDVVGDLERVEGGDHEVLGERALASGVRTATRSPLRQALMGVQVALAAIVLVVAGLFFESFTGARDASFTPAANNNASGCAVLLDLAARLREFRAEVKRQADDLGETPAYEVAQRGAVATRDRRDAREADVTALLAAVPARHAVEIHARYSRLDALVGIGELRKLRAAIFRERDLRAVDARERRGHDLALPLDDALVPIQSEAHDPSPEAGLRCDALDHVLGDGA